MNIWWELSHKIGQERGYSKMIGNTAELTSLSRSHSGDVLYVPLYFFHCRNDGLSLPLIALIIVGQKSIQPLTFGFCQRINLLGSQRWINRRDYIERYNLASI